MNATQEESLDKDPRKASDAVADLAQRLLRENTLLQDEIDRLNRILKQYQKCS